jgi:hypothetical protein
MPPISPNTTPDSPGVLRSLANHHGSSQPYDTTTQLYLPNWRPGGTSGASTPMAPTPLHQSMCLPADWDPGSNGTIDSINAECANFALAPADGTFMSTSTGHSSGDTEPVPDPPGVVRRNTFFNVPFDLPQAVPNSHSSVVWLCVDRSAPAAAVAPPLPQRVRCPHCSQVVDVRAKPIGRPA